MTLRALLLLVVLFLLTDVRTASALFWVKGIIASTGDVGSHASLTIGPNYRNYISYYDATSGDLKLARSTSSGSWVIATIDSVGNVGQFTAIAVAKGGIHIGYYDVTNGNLKHAMGVWTSTGCCTWSINTVASAGAIGKFASIVIDSSGVPHMSYYDETNGNLMYTKFTPSAWENETVEASGNVGQYTWIAVDSNGVPHISYYDVTNGDLKYAVKPSATARWTIETVDSDGDVGTYSSIKVDSTGLPHISYRNATLETLNYATRTATGAAWKRQEVRSKGTRWTSIALDSSNSPRISAYEQSFGRLWYVRKTAGDWNSDNLDFIPNLPPSAAGVGLYSSLALVGNTPRISYYDGSNGNLKFAIGY